MIEQRALTKICPMSMATPEIRACDGTGIREAGPHLCFGSACMAWRHMRADWYTPDDLSEMKNVEGGYCGLAGKP